MRYKGIGRRNLFSFFLLTLWYTEPMFRNRETINKTFKIVAVIIVAAMVFLTLGASLFN